MKFTLDWLRDHLETDAPVGEIADALTDLGLEVESVRDPAQRLAGFTVGKVLAAEPHPDADRLRVCRVMTGEGERQIICGAPNARAGISVVVAMPGAYVPGIDTTIGVGKIRGVESHGMMCSQREMELGDDHDGIIELPEDSPASAIGDAFPDWLAANDPAKVDPVIEIAVTPNRPDALGVRGIAFDLAARGIGAMKPAEIPEIVGEFPCPVSVSIDADTRDGGCHVFAARLIREVRNGPSPQWLRDRLTAIGLRPISALVDVTNFLSFDRNRPLHVFDADKVQGDLRVHRAREGDTVVGLDEREYRLAPGQVVISDDAGVASIAGIMGGLRTGCTEETTSVLLEAALWDPIQIARTGRALKIVSDARHRNERGIDPAFNMDGHAIATQLILDLCGGAASETFVAGEIPEHARAYRLDPGRVRALAGMEIAEAEQRAILERLGFRMEGEMAHVPSWRPDVMGEADLVEEIARVASLANLEGQPLPKIDDGVREPILSRAQRIEADARRAFVTLGYNECVTYSFIDAASARLFGGGTDATRLANPISSEMSHMRPDLLPGLLQAAARNQARGLADVALFEVGHVFDGGEPGQQRLQATGLLVGRAVARNPHESARGADAFDAREGAEAVLAALAAPPGAQIARSDEPWWHPGRHGQIRLGPSVLGTFGEVNPRVLAEMDVKGPAVAFALNPSEIPAPRRAGAGRKPLKASDLQAVERDFAFVVGAEIAAAEVAAAAAGADKALIESVEVFDTFSDASLGAGMKSVAIAVRMRPQTATLTDADIEAASAKIVEKVHKATGGTLRG